MELYEIDHHVDESDAVPLRDFDQLSCLVRQIAGRPAEQEPERASDGGDGGSQFVADARDEFLQAGAAGVQLMLERGDPIEMTFKCRRSSAAAA
jgi:hypothetical protein